jgi:hypothetical protein
MPIPIPCNALQFLVLSHHALALSRPPTSSAFIPRRPPCQAPRPDLSIRHLHHTRRLPCQFPIRHPPPPCHPLALTTVSPCRLLIRLKSSLPWLRPMRPPWPLNPPFLKPLVTLRSTMPHLPISRSLVLRPLFASRSHTLRTSPSSRSRVNPRTPTSSTVSTPLTFATSTSVQAQLPHHSPARFRQDRLMDTCAPSQNLVLWPRTSTSPSFDNPCGYTCMLR